VVNGVDLNRHQATMGPVLTFDGKNERFTGERADEANVFLKNQYRSGWEVPQIG
jgi:hypothetical protein